MKLIDQNSLIETTHRITSYGKYLDGQRCVETSEHCSSSLEERGQPGGADLPRPSARNRSFGTRGRSRKGWKEGSTSVGRNTSEAPGLHPSSSVNVSKFMDHPTTKDIWYPKTCDISLCLWYRHCDVTWSWTFCDYVRILFYFIVIFCYKAQVE